MLAHLSLEVLLLLFEVLHLLLLLELLLVEFLSLEHEFLEELILPCFGFEHFVLCLQESILFLQHLFTQVAFIEDKLSGISGPSVHLCDSGSRENEQERADLFSLCTCISDGLLQFGLLDTQFPLGTPEVSLQTEQLSLQCVQFGLQSVNML